MNTIFKCEVCNNLITTRFTYVYKWILKDNKEQYAHFLCYMQKWKNKDKDEIDEKCKYKPYLVNIREEFKKIQ